MPRPIRSRDAGRRGYVSLLAISFAFGLAAFGTAVAVSVRSYVVASIRQETRILDRIALESAINNHLGRLAAGLSDPAVPKTLSVKPWLGREVVVATSWPEGKIDVAMDDEVSLRAAIRPVIREAPPDLVGVQSLIEAFRRFGATSAQEDCLRSGVTMGRAPEALEPSASLSAENDLTRQVSAGDQLDARAAIRRGERSVVLWQRVRFEEDEEATWRLHDYRSLTFEGDRCSDGSMSAH